MKYVLSLVLFVVLFATNAFAIVQDPIVNVTTNAGTTTTVRQVNVNYENQTNFGDVGAWGNTTPGNPGYLVLKGCDVANNCYPYYLWIDSSGNLRQASYIAISSFVSFPTGSWNLTTMGTPGGKVGSQ